MDESAIQPGDIVRLKSGGPDMTIASIEDDGRIVCQWFYRGVLEQRSFSVPALLKVGRNQRGISAAPDGI